MGATFAGYHVALWEGDTWLMATWLPAPPRVGEHLILFGQDGLPLDDYVVCAVTYYARADHAPILPNDHHVVVQRVADNGGD